MRSDGFNQDQVRSGQTFLHLIRVNAVETLKKYQIIDSLISKMNHAFKAAVIDIFMTRENTVTVHRQTIITNYLQLVSV